MTFVYDYQEAITPDVLPALYPARAARDHPVSLQAISWALDCSRAKGNDRLVMIVLAHHADDLGYTALSKGTLSEETRLHEDTIRRAQQTLVELREIEWLRNPPFPDWYLGIPQNRRPRLYSLVAFVGSDFAVPVRKRRGAAQGSRGGGSGVVTPPADQDRRDANSEPRTDKNDASPLRENEKLPDKRCPRCFGYGWFQTAVGDCRRDGAGPVKARCSCTYIVDPILALVEQ